MKFTDYKTLTFVRNELETVSESDIDSYSVECSFCNDGLGIYKYSGTNSEDTKETVHVCSDCWDIVKDSFKVIQNRISDICKSIDCESCTNTCDSCIEIDETGKSCALILRENKRICPSCFDSETKAKGINYK